MQCPGSLRNLTPLTSVWTDHITAPSCLVTSHWTENWMIRCVAFGWFHFLHPLHFQDHREHFSLPYASSHSLSRQVGTLRLPAPAPPPVMIGVMRYKRDLIFGRWQERTFVLTNKYLKSFDRNHMKIAGATSLPQQPQAKPQVLWKVTWLMCNESEFHSDILLHIHILD